MVRGKINIIWTALLKADVADDMTWVGYGTLEVYNQSIIALLY